ncbi:MAG TPA: MerR family transcriptional regulator [Solirubrobacteraceae bacterium]
MTDATELTIDELAHRVGMTVRNVRAHQSRGLLTAPRLKGRTGYYDEEHVARLELIKDLQAEGLNLEAIRAILQRTPGSSVSQVLGFTRAVAEPFSDEQPELRTAEQLAADWGDQITPELEQKIIKLGLIRRTGNGSYEVLSPRLEATAREIIALGIPASAAVEVAEDLRRHSESIAKTYVRLFIKHVLRPAQEQGGQERWPELQDSLARIRPLAAEALVAVFGLTMTEQVEKAMERELERMSREKKKR